MVFYAPASYESVRHASEFTSDGAGLSGGDHGRLAGERGGEVNGVVASQSFSLGQISGDEHEFRGARYHIELGPERVEFGLRRRQSVGLQAAAATCRRERCSRFGVADLRAHHDVRLERQLVLSVSTNFVVAEQLEERRRVDVSDHCRCCATSDPSGSAKGYSATTIADIEAASGLTPGAGGTYRHFGSKREILHAAIDAALAQSDAILISQKRLVAAWAQLYRSAIATASVA